MESEKNMSSLSPLKGYTPKFMIHDDIIWDDIICDVILGKNIMKFTKEEIYMLDELCQNKNKPIFYNGSWILNKVVAILETIGLKEGKDFIRVSDLGDNGLKLLESGFQFIQTIEEQVAENIIEELSIIKKSGKKQDIPLEVIREKMQEGKIKFFNSLIKLEGK